MHRFLLPLIALTGICTTTIAQCPPWHLGVAQEVVLGCDCSGIFCNNCAEQGVAADSATGLFYASKGSDPKFQVLTKYDSQWNYLDDEIVNYDNASDHMGDITVVGDFIYAPLKGSDLFGNIDLLHIAWFDKSTLEHVGHTDVIELDILFGIDEGDIAGVAHDAGKLYVIEWQPDDPGSPTPHIFKFNLLENGALDLSQYSIFQIPTRYANGIEIVGDFVLVSYGNTSGDDAGAIDVYGLNDITAGPIFTWTFNVLDFGGYLGEHAQGLTYANGKLWVSQIFRVHHLDTNTAPAFPEGLIQDCFGNCAPADWVGDGICDDGSYSWPPVGGVPIYFNCDEFDNDGGDCDCVAGPTITVGPGGQYDYTNIQAAIDIACDGDEVVVAPGTYPDTINLLGKAITVRSSGGPAVTTIDGQGNGSVVTCTNGEGPDTVLDGFTVTGGTGTLYKGLLYGGGMYNYQSSPTVIECIFIANSPDAGGGMSNTFSSPAITNCTFGGNSATYGGGLVNILNSNPTVTSCTFSGNSANFGGGLYNGASSNPTVTNCTISDNTAINGGGMFNILIGGPTVTNCTFSGNTANTGGGMFNTESSPTVTNCTFSGNTSNLWGGGMMNIAGSPTVTSCTFSGNMANLGGGLYNTAGSIPTVTNCTFSANIADSGGGMYNLSSPVVTNCTFDANSAGNYGGGMSNWDGSSPTVTDCTFSNNSASYGGGMSNRDNSSPEVTNCIFSNNSVSRGGGIYNYKSSPTVTDCTFAGNSASSRGGGIFNFNSCNPTVTNCTFDNNSAGNGGGGMYNWVHCNPTVTNCTFIDNSAPGNYGQGGGMKNWQFSSPAVTNCTFQGNSANNGAGGIHNVYESTPTVADSIFCENTGDIGGDPIDDGGGNCFADSCADKNGNGVPDECECTGDIDGGGTVGASDLLILLACFGGPADDCANPYADINGDGFVNAVDLTFLLVNWGPCP